MQAIIAEEEVAVIQSWVAVLLKLIKLNHDNDTVWIRVALENCEQAFLSASKGSWRTTLNATVGLRSFISCIPFNPDAPERVVVESACEYLQAVESRLRRINVSIDGEEK